MASTRPLGPCRIAIPSYAWRTDQPLTTFLGAGARSEGRREPVVSTPEPADAIMDIDCAGGWGGDMGGSRDRGPEPTCRAWLSRTNWLGQCGLDCRQTGQSDRLLRCLKDRRMCASCRGFQRLP